MACAVHVGATTDFLGIVHSYRLGVILVEINAGFDNAAVPFKCHQLIHNAPVRVSGPESDQAFRNGLVVLNAHFLFSIISMVLINASWTRGNSPSALCRA